MILKKANAAFGLLSILLLLAHAGYQVVAYIMFIYNPQVTKILAWICLAAVCIHAILGMAILFFSHDGSALSKYRKDNRRTILQRGSAIGILGMLVLHLQCYTLVKSGPLGLFAAEVIQAVFFACIFTHIATSFSNAFVTLGVLENPKTKKKIDMIVWIICALCFLVAAIIVGKTYFALAEMPA